LTAATGASYPSPERRHATDQDKDSQTAGQAPSVLGAGTAVEGEVSGNGDLVIRGRVRGRIDLGGSLTVDPAGDLEADVVAGGTVRLEAGSRVVGDIRATRVVIVDGASYRGSVDTAGASPATPASDAGAPSPDAGLAGLARRLTVRGT
jgi:cytoskeletal protein CcmA (bactofilin family)